MTWKIPEVQHSHVEALAIRGHLKPRPQISESPASPQAHLDSKYINDRLDMPGLATEPAQCIASTDTDFDGPLHQTSTEGKHVDGHSFDKSLESNFFHTAKLSGDGTTIVTYNEDQKWRTYVLPTNLLEDQEHVLKLTPFAISNPVKTRCSALYPHYVLSESSTTLALHSLTDTRIRLVNVLDFDYVHATYPWINADTEEIVTPHSLLFSPDGTRFVAGAKERIALFDLSRTNEGPVQSHKTCRSKAVRREYGEYETPLSGIVNALAINQVNGLLAAGSTERQLGFWEAGGSGGRISAFSVRDDTLPETKGCGITQVEWSDCGQYLLVAERGSNVILVFDIRQGKRLCWLRGRNAKSMQRMSFQVVQSADGQLQGRTDIWAGGIDGHVRVWKDVTHQTDAVCPSTDIVAHRGLFDLSRFLLPLLISTQTLSRAS